MQKKSISSWLMKPPDIFLTLMLMT